MKPGALKHFIVPFFIALVLYASAYSWIEHRRTRNGPWETEFTIEARTPALVINQSKLQIQNVRISFPEEHLATNFSRSFTFEQPRQWPYELAFGKCVFMDTTFLPGNITFEIFGHQIQLLPRVLTIDAKEIPWRSNTNIPLSGIVRPALPR